MESNSRIEKNGDPMTDKNECLFYVIAIMFALVEYLYLLVFKPNICCHWASKK